MHNCALMVVLLVVSCSSVPTPPTACSNIAGSYQRADFAMTLSQYECHVLGQGYPGVFGHQDQTVLHYFDLTVSGNVATGTVVRTAPPNQGGCRATMYVTYTQKSDGSLTGSVTGSDGNCGLVRNMKETFIYNKVQSPSPQVSPASPPPPSPVAPTPETCSANEVLCKCSQGSRCCPGSVCECKPGPYAEGLPFCPFVRP